MRMHAIIIDTFAYMALSHLLNYPKRIGPRSQRSILRIDATDNFETRLKIQFRGDGCIKFMLRISSSWCPPELAKVAKATPLNLSKLNPQRPQWAHADSYTCSRKRGKVIT